MFQICICWHDSNELKSNLWRETWLNVPTLISSLTVPVLSRKQTCVVSLLDDHKRDRRKVTLFKRRTCPTYSSHLMQQHLAKLSFTYTIAAQKDKTISKTDYSYSSPINIYLPIEYDPWRFLTCSPPERDEMFPTFRNTMFLFLWVWKIETNKKKKRVELMFLPYHTSVDWPSLRILHQLIQVLDDFFPMSLGRHQSTILGYLRPIHRRHNLWLKRI